MSKTVLIFGYSGFVGPYLAKEFIEAGYNVVGSDVAESTNDLCHIPFKTVDILDFENLKKIIDSLKPNFIINLAAISSVGQSWKMPQTTIEVNVLGALNILEASKSVYPMPKVMFIGSSEEYKQSTLPLTEKSELASNNPYGISKIAQEFFVQSYRKRYGMKIYCVRSFNHTGVGQKETFVIPSFCKQVAEIEKSGKPGVIKVGNLDVFRDFTDVRDVVRAYRMIIEQNDCDTVFNIGSGKAISLKALLDFIISLSKQKITIEIDQQKCRPVDTPYICCDNSLIVSNIGWRPLYSINDTIKGMFKYFLK